MNVENLLTDDELLRGLQCSDERAFKQIYNHYSPDLVNFAARRLESLAEARDVVQDVFVNLWAKRATIQINHSFRSYLYSAIRYKVIDHIRKNIQRDYYSDVVRSLRTDAENTIYDDIFCKELNSFLDTEIGKLPSRIREVFLLSRKQHLSVREIASQLNVSEQTVKNQLSAALKKLRSSLDKIVFLMLLFWH